MVEEKSSCHLNRIVEIRHFLDPFCEVINDNDHVIMVFRQRLTLHEVDPPFVKGTDTDDRVEWSRWSSSLHGKDLASGAMLDCHDAFMKESGLEVTCSDDFIVSGHS